MVDLGSIQSAIGSLQVAGNMAKALIGLQNAAAIKAKTIELQEAILSAQSGALNAMSEQSALLDRIRDLEEEVACMKTWNAEKQRYQLTNIGAGQLVYALKEQEGTGEPPHMLCANCYNRGEKSILQSETRNPGRHKVLFCQNPNCEAELFSNETGGRGSEHPIRVITKRPR